MNLHQIPGTQVVRHTTPKLLAGIAAVCALMVSVSNAETRSPNVVLLLADDLGWQDIGCYGGPVNTPALDRLAEGGMRFTDFYSGAAVCSPSRAVLLTGRTNVRCSIYSWINDYDQRSHLPVSEVTLAELLKARGYATAHFGKWHLGMPSGPFPKKPTPADHGFDYWFATANNAQPSHRNPHNFVRNGKSVGKLDGYACDLVVNESLSWLEKRNDTDKPFFLNVWFHEPHAPLAAPDELVKQYGELNDPAAIYSATIENTDRAVERLVKRLHQIDAPEDTIIIYASDNGSYRADRVGGLRATKGSNYEGGIRVPGIFYWPGHIHAGAVQSEPAGLVDIVPTVCGLLGIDKPKTHLDGADLSALLTGTADGFSRDQSLYWCLPLSGPAIALRDGQYGMVAYRKGEVPRDKEAIAEIKQDIEALLRSKGIYERETRSSTFSKQLFEGFADRDAEKLRGQFIRLNQFHESWIPALKQSQFTRFELYDLKNDPSQRQELSVRKPQIHARLKKEMLQITADVMTEAFDWSSKRPAPTVRVHRLKSTFRSPFDAFVYVNRIPVKPEPDETPDDLAGRILGRLANQEGRVLVKLPPGMNRLAYEGFKAGLKGARCISCHHLPDWGRAVSDKPVPSLRNRSYSKERFRKLILNETHRDIPLSDNSINLLHAFQRILTDVPDVEFRNLILNAEVVD